MDSEDRERWRELATYRADPPGFISSDRNRKKVFAAGLQQAQEFADAAATSGYATKALPLFYAFGQAMRAFAAAFVEGDDWRISSHGAIFKGQNKILDSIIEPQAEGQRGTIQVLCELDQTQMPTERVTLGQLWRASQRVPLASELYDAPSSFMLRPPFVQGHSAIDAGQGVITFALHHLSASGTTADELKALLPCYPVLDELKAASAVDLVDQPAYAGRLRRVGDQAVYVDATPNQGLILPGYEWARDALVLQMPTFAHDLASYGKFYELLKLDGTQPLLPAMGGVSEPGWLFIEWARLFALSNIVRYYPAEWVAALDLDRSTLAVPLQRLSDDYEKWLPMMMLTIMEGKAASLSR